MPLTSAASQHAAFMLLPFSSHLKDSKKGGKREQARDVTETSRWFQEGLMTTKAGKMATKAENLSYCSVEVKKKQA